MVRLLGSQTALETKRCWPQTQKIFSVTPLEDETGLANVFLRIENEKRFQVKAAPMLRPAQ
jgi:hypothetical protein